jgi:hypothetical protein
MSARNHPLLARAGEASGGPRGVADAVRAMTIQHAWAAPTGGCSCASLAESRELSFAVRFASVTLRMASTLLMWLCVIDTLMYCEWMHRLLARALAHALLLAERLLRCVERGLRLGWRALSLVARALNLLARALERRPRRSRRSEDERDGLCCIACCTNERSALLEPCRHAVLCRACADELTECPVCRARIKSRTRVYL